MGRLTLASTPRAPLVVQRSLTTAPAEAPDAAVGARAAIEDAPSRGALMTLPRRRFPRRASRRGPTLRLVQERAESAEVGSRSEVDCPQVAAWLLGCGGLVAGMVSVGGLTRLTRSGLSMTDWKLRGSLPPRTLAEWETEFERL